MLLLSGEEAAATSEAGRTAVLGAATAMVATYRGTSFDVYYVLNAIALLLFSLLMWMLLHNAYRTLRPLILQKWIVNDDGCRGAIHPDEPCNRPPDSLLACLVL